MIDNTKEYILSAAIYYNDGKEYKQQPEGITTGFVISGYRHNNIIYLLFILLKDNFDKTKMTQGFLTSNNRFVNRKKAMKIALESVQITDVIGGNILTSEDLY